MIIVSIECTGYAMDRIGEELKDRPTQGTPRCASCRAKTNSNGKRAIHRIVASLDKETSSSKHEPIQSIAKHPQKAENEIKSLRATVANLNGVEQENDALKEENTILKAKIEKAELILSKQFNRDEQLGDLIILDGTAADYLVQIVSLIDDVIEKDLQQDDEESINMRIVLPILDSIIAAEGCAVRKIEFPIKWREEASTEFSAFLERYNELWITRTENNAAICHCIKCKRSAINDDVWVNTEGEAEDIAQGVTCTNCLNHICDDCNDFENADFEDLLLFSCGGNCWKEFCVECSTPKICDFSGCLNYLYCTDCHVHIDHKCADSECNASICDKCISSAKCSICEQLFCCDVDECQVAINPCPCCDEPVCSGCLSKIRCDLCPVQWCKRCAEQGLCSRCKSDAKDVLERLRTGCWERL
jgi:hypothetical protein